MNAHDIALKRLQNQQISETEFKTPEKLISWLGALQGQDYTGAKWAMGLRLPGTMDTDIEKAIRERKIVRTWPMRGTLHFVAADDVHWMLQLLTPRILSGGAARHRSLELDEKIFSKSFSTLEKAMQGGKILTRPEALQVLEKAGISTSGQRGYHILWRAAHQGLICFGPIQRKQQTFTLLDEWIPSVKKFSRSEALAEITRKYFCSHGSATIPDFVWWSGLKVAEAKEGLDLAADELISENIDGVTYWMSKEMKTAKKNTASIFLLPGFDEYLLGYKDRRAVLDSQYSQRVCPGANGMFLSTIVSNGRVVGTWKRSFQKDTVVLAYTPFTTFSAAEKKAIETAAVPYGKFLGMKVQKRKHYDA